MKRIVVAIDTSNTDTTNVALIIDGQRFEKYIESKQLKSQTALPLIEELLREHDVAVGEISEISLHAGPGSFTGLRVGAAIANALGYTLHVPVNGQDKPIIPSY